LVPGVVRQGFSERRDCSEEMDRKAPLIRKWKEQKPEEKPKLQESSKR